jgi:uncharacterized protein
MVLAYNLIMLAVDVAVLAVVRWKRSLLVWCAVMVGGGTAALAAAVLLATQEMHGGRHYLLYSLAGYGIFLHGSVLLLLSTFLLWRRNRLVAVASSLLAGGILFVAFDAFVVEPTWLEVSHVQIVSEKIRYPLKIAVVADLQTDEVGTYERAVLRLVMEEKPDLILLAGDYLQTPPARYAEVCRQLRALLRDSRLRAPCGVFAVRGNVDEEDWCDLFADLDITTAPATRSFELDPLRLTCLSLDDSADTAAEVLAADRQRFHLVLGHIPNFALGHIEADLLVAGHTHGGQVRLPGIGPVITYSEIPRRWAAGLSELPSGAKLLVSRGIGMERQRNAPRLRLLCRPELVFIELVPASP